MKSIKDIDLSPKPGNKYWVNCHRKWREEFIYFLLIDANFRKESNVLRFGRMFIREISTDGIHFKLPDCPKCTLAFSRILYDEEVLFVYNSSPRDVKQECVLIDNQLNKTNKWMKPVYGATTNIEIQHSEDPANAVCYIHLYLRHMQLVILKNY